MKKLFLSVAVVATTLFSCNNDDSNLKPDYPTTNIKCQLNSLDINSEKDSDKELCEANVKKNVPAYVKGIKVTAKCVNRIPVVNEFTFQSLKDNETEDNIVLEDIYLGKNTFSTEIIPSETCKMGNYADELESKDSFVNAPIAANCDDITTGEIDITKNYSETIDLGEFDLMTGALKFILEKPDSKFVGKVMFKKDGKYLTFGGADEIVLTTDMGVLINDNYEDNDVVTLEYYIKGGKFGDDYYKIASTDYTIKEGICKIQTICYKENKINTERIANVTIVFKEIVNDDNGVDVWSDVLAEDIYFYETDGEGNVLSGRPGNNLTDIKAGEEVNLYNYVAIYPDNATIKNLRFTVNGEEAVDGKYTFEAEKDYNMIVYTLDGSGLAIEKSFQVQKGEEEDYSHLEFYYGAGNTLKLKANSFYSYTALTHIVPELNGNGFKSFEFQVGGFVESIPMKLPSPTGGKKQMVSKINVLSVILYNTEGFLDIVTHDPMETSLFIKATMTDGTVVTKEVTLVIS